MTKKKVNFLIGLITFLVVLNFLFKEKEFDQSNVMVITASFNRVDGIQIGSDVRISGVKIGHVSQLELKDNKPNLDFLVYESLDIPNDSSVSIQTDGLFGSKYVLIEPGGSDEVIKNKEKIIFTEDSILIEEILNQIIEIGQKKGRNET